MNPTSGTGLLFALVTVTVWGAQLPIAKVAMADIDGYTISLVRYGLAVVGLLPILAWREGTASLSLGGQGWLALAAGTIGMGGSAVLCFVGLTLTRPETAVIIIALQPVMTAIGEWITKGRRPHPFTIACLLAAFAGVVTAVTRGGSALEELAGSSGRELLGDALVFTGAIAWVSYALMAEQFRGWSSLRVSTLTCTLALVLIVPVWIVALLLGAARVPSGPALAEHGWRLAYLGVLGVLAAMFLWNAGIRRIGALNAMLVLSLMPVITFAFRAFEGARFHNSELLGAGVVVGALIANNLYLRLQSAPAPAVSAFPEP